MYLINTTFQADNDISADFVDFVSNEMIPVAVHECGMADPVFTRIRPHAGSDTTEKTTGYALQLRAPSESAFESYCSDCLPAFLEALFGRWGQRVVHFTSVLDIIKR